MNVTFKAIGLTFEAEIKAVLFDLSRTHGQPDNREEPDSLDVVFDSLTCNGKDALFLLDSDLLSKIEDAAHSAAVLSYWSGD
jgi:hypothetical protein